MNKKIFGIRVGTIITFIVCIIVAIVVWLYAEITSAPEQISELFESFHLTL